MDRTKADELTAALTPTAEVLLRIEAAWKAVVSDVNKDKLAGMLWADVVQTAQAAADTAYAKARVAREEFFANGRYPKRHGLPVEHFMAPREANLRVLLDALTGKPLGATELGKAIYALHHSTACGRTGQLMVNPTQAELDIALNKEHADTFRGALRQLTASSGPLAEQAATTLEMVDSTDEEFDAMLDDLPELLRSLRPSMRAFVVAQADPERARLTVEALMAMGRSADSQAPDGTHISN